MAINKVEINGETKLDLTQDTVTPERLLFGVTAHNSAGDQIVGKYQSVALTGLEITAPPEKTDYTTGETFDPTGMVVTATFSNGEQLQPVNYQVAPSGPLSPETTQVMISYTWNGVTKTAYQTVSVVSASIYGVYWDWASNNGLTKGVRTDSAAAFADPEPAVNNGTGSSPFDNLMPWAGMVKETDATAGVLVKIPRFWYKWTRSGKSMKLQIADAAVNGFHTSPAHADRGDGKGERDYVYIGRYHCASGYKSQAGSQPLTEMTRSQARTNIHNLGATYWQYDFAMYWTIMMLYLVEFADWNSQKTIGYGCSLSEKKFNMGLTDSMQYHTGTSAANRTAYDCTQYRYIEGLWDNVFDWCDGIYFSEANVYCIKNPAQFSDTGNGTLVGTRATDNGYISEWTNPTASGFEYSLYPNAVNGSENTYVCDTSYYNFKGVVLRVGGGYILSQDSGAFWFDGSLDVSASWVGTGCRLQKLP